MHRAGGADDGLAGEDAPPARLLPLLRPRQRGRRHPGNNRCLFDRGVVAGEVVAGSNGRGVNQVTTGVCLTVLLLLGRLLLDQMGEVSTR